MSPYRISLEVYEGPVDLLLYFIQRDKLDVLDVPVSRLADEFLEYVKTMGADLEELSEFLLMAAILLRWKMRVLLRESIDTAEEASEPVTLTRILEEFHRYRETAGFLEEKRGKNVRSFPRGQLIKVEDKGNIADLLHSFTALLERERPRQPMLLSRDDWTVEEATDWMHDHLKRMGKFKFFDTMRARQSNMFDIMVLFLAVLEQLRLRQVKVTQPEPFADFVVEAKT